MAGRRVFVTGAGGFIGRRLVDILAEAGAEVSALRRTPARAGPARTVVGDLADAALLERALQGQEAVFHLAYDGRASAAANLAAFDAVRGAAEKAGVGRIVHASSIVVYDGWPGRDLDETGSMQRPGGSGYRQAKIEMERRLMAGPLPAAILQPTLVYGPGSAFWTDQFIEWLGMGGNVVLPAPEGHCHGVFVDDVVQALLRAATLPDLGQERFIVSGEDPFPWSRLLEGYARIAGRGGVRHVPLDELRARLGPEPEDDHHDEGPSRLAIIHAAGRRILGRERFERLLRQIKGRLAGGGDMYPDQHLLGVYTAGGRCSIERARERLGYAPEFDLEKGLAATAAAWRP